MLKLSASASRLSRTQRFARELYAKNDQTFPEDTVAEMQTAFFEGSAYASRTNGSGRPPLAARILQTESRGARPEQTPSYATARATVV